MLTVSRWYNPENPGETARMGCLAAAALISSGMNDPSQHIIIADTGKVATMLVCAAPFSRGDILSIKNTCARLKYDLMLAPGEPPSNALIGKIASSSTMEQLDKTVEDEPLNYRPPTDETPFFFNMLKLDRLGFALKHEAGVLRGNILANLTLLTLVGSIFFLTLLMAAASLMPRISGKKNVSGLLPQAAAYFSLIGAGFMLVEIAMIQKLSVFLGRPDYALGILLFSIILSAGLGSLLSERMPLDKEPWAYIYPAVISLLLLALIFITPAITGSMASSGIFTRIAASIIVVWPAGMAMGVCFPVGMRILKTADNAAIPCYIAFNGIFGVLFSAGAICISIYSGITTNLYMAVICYFLLLICLPGMLKAGPAVDWSPPD